MVFMLLFLPIELVLLAVVYRSSTDTLFKIELRKLTGISDFDRRKEDIGYLMRPDIALRRSGTNTGSFAQAVELVEDTPSD